MKNDPENKWVLLRIASNSLQAEWMKSLLEESQIEVVLLNKQDSSYLLGVIELYVQDSNVLSAQSILKKSESES